jgi:predicted Zn-dependent protease
MIKQSNKRSGSLIWRLLTIPLVCAQIAWPLAAAQPAQALFFGYNQQAEAYKQQGDAARDAQNFGMAVNYYTSAINILPYDAAQNLADIYYARAIANDVTGQYQRATSDWQAAHDNYAKCVQSGQSGNNLSYDKEYQDELGRLITWRATENPNTPDYMECGPMKRFAQSSNVRVFIDTTEASGFSYDLRYLIFQAMYQWCQFPGSPIRMQQWGTADGANIIVQRANAAGQIGFGAAGQTNSQDAVNAQGQDIMSRSFVRLTATGYNGNTMSQGDKDKLYNLALHETGHALGIGGHSPSGLDVMYFKSPLLKLSDRDAATMRKMYQ